MNSGDGTITILDARQCVAQCSVPDQCVDPERTAWEPVGPRSVPYIGDAGDPSGGDVLGNPAAYFRGLHADSVNSDQVAIATPPVFEQGWIAEPEMRVGAGPVFDGSGNVYFSPGRSDVEDVFLVSLNPDDGSRRWKIEGVTSACGSTLVLDDPDNPGEEIIYQGCYDRAVAVKPDADTNLDQIVETSEMIWDVSTGLAGSGQSVADRHQGHRAFGRCRLFRTGAADPPGRRQHKILLHVLFRRRSALPLHHFGVERRFQTA